MYFKNLDNLYVFYTGNKNKDKQIKKIIDRYYYL